ncbi:phosphonate metabolism protein/1,5-bisphosphokinase (PRPP-forming) PhnN [Salipiger bermudensis]|uniref:phosphonate metabolism protein/1,5-bisphosphokinase (PRPP-forming) PhnN n=1 Tax=Salipiger bermudensis TaxID=344736 RepID=UPI001C996B72|nr:phosphonate metabolism protein/1,5-bisphosphokinase (PRPP-forming) PhnN [Salipiger bermudensis]MBY6004530.1 phosphonate metabolism protein/1,5-bisphosphokinase (PRPP-forming) PhnN [Salipiger bermudensis]
MSRRFFAVVGPSGVGKDTLMEALAARVPGLHLVRRVITRPESAGGEAFEGVSEADFEARVATGDFALHWRAHGLRYGVPASVDAVLAEGRPALCNLSRAVLPEAAERFAAMRVLHVTARPEVLARRLAGRGRESEDEIATRLARAGFPLPGGLDVVEIDNSGALEAAVAAALAALQPVRA